MGTPDPRVCKHVFLEKDYHECQICSKQFTTQFNLKRHKEGNCQEKVCKKCNLRFQKTSQLNSHLPNCDGQAPYHCEFCVKSFLKNSNLNRHRQTHTEKCSKCKAVFYKRLPLVSAPSVYPSLTCDYCREVFVTRELLDSHLYRHQSEFKLQCEGCPILFEKKRQLLKHKIKCHPDLSAQAKHRKTYECSLCKVFFYLYRDLKSHLQSHIDQGEKVYRCKICQKGYNRKVSLKIHVSKHSKIEIKPRCDICRKVFSHPYSLRAHRRIHLKLRPYKCDKCDETFGQHSQLVKHKLTHNDSSSATSKLRRCNICEKSFDSIASLRVHKLTHKTNNSYSCDQCDKKFVHQKTLTDHMNVHTGEKPHACSVCALSFSLFGQLYRHKATHMDQHSCMVTEHGPTFTPQQQQQQSLLNEPINSQPLTSQPITSQPINTQLGEIGSNVGVSVTYADSLFLPIQMNLQGTTITPIQNHLQPVQNTFGFHSTVQPAAQLSESMTLQQLPAQIPLQMQAPADLLKLRQTITTNGNMQPQPAYWQLPQSNFFQYDPQQSKPISGLYIAPHDNNVSASNITASLCTSTMDNSVTPSMNASTIDVIAHGMHQL